MRLPFVRGQALDPAQQGREGAYLGLSKHHLSGQAPTPSAARMQWSQSCDRHPALAMHAQVRPLINRHATGAAAVNAGEGAHSWSAGNLHPAGGRSCCPVCGRRSRIRPARCLAAVRSPRRSRSDAEPGPGLGRATRSGSGRSTPEGSAGSDRLNLAGSTSLTDDAGVNSRLIVRHAVENGQRRPSRVGRPGGRNPRLLAFEPLV